MSRLLPHPVLSLVLFVLWLLLVNGPTAGSLMMAALLAVILPLAARRWLGSPAPVRHLPALLAYGLLVLWDIVLANLQVARIILFLPRDRIRSAWIAVPVTLHSPEAITLLAGTITMTPGTVTADMTPDGRVLLIHALHAPDPDAVRDDIKTRYEARLKRIFDE